jgi:hypothetical protein
MSPSSAAYVQTTGVDGQVLRREAKALVEVHERSVDSCRRVAFAEGSTADLVALERDLRAATEGHVGEALLGFDLGLVIGRVGPGGAKLLGGVRPVGVDELAPLLLERWRSWRGRALSLGKGRGGGQAQE